ncbi:hypothetical protein [Leptothrix cholodnii]|uniref:hypothetical protein n=1 Tax=Leptothrix cholodnii TaxID=34029 RepID=UPI00167FA6B9|nr:hypothetical protein [Leptothrix cholodnii]
MVCIDSASAAASTVATLPSTVPAASPPPQPLIASTMAESEKIPDLNARIFISDSAKNIFLIPRPVFYQYLHQILADTSWRRALNESG